MRLRAGRSARVRRHRSTRRRRCRHNPAERTSSSRVLLVTPSTRSLRSPRQRIDRPADVPRRGRTVPPTATPRLVDTTVRAHCSPPAHGRRPCRETTAAGRADRRGRRAAAGIDGEPRPAPRPSRCTLSTTGAITTRAADHGIVFSSSIDMNGPTAATDGIASDGACTILSRHRTASSRTDASVSPSAISRWSIVAQLSKS